MALGSNRFESCTTHQTETSRERPATWKMNQPGAGTDSNSVGTYGSGDQGLRLPPDRDSWRDSTMENVCSLAKHACLLNRWFGSSRGFDSLILRQIETAWRDKQCGWRMLVGEACWFGKPVDLTVPRVRLPCQSASMDLDRHGRGHRLEIGCG